MERGDNPTKRKLAPPYVTIGKRRIPLDILAFAVGLVLIGFTQQIAQSIQANPTDLTKVGEVLLGLGALFFIFGRIEPKK